MARIPPYKPQLAQLVKTAPSGPDWVHEMKYDGYRIGCRIENGRITLLSRNGKDWTEAFEEIARAARAMKARTALLDGEVCMVLPDGRTSFQALQNRAEGRLVYFVFDLLHLDGRDFIPEPLDVRKEALRKIVKGDRILFGDHLDADGPVAFREACRLRLEGIISKDRHLPYLLGKRGRWLKTKCVRRQEFVIGGFTDPEGARVGIGALLVGYYDGHDLVFAGKVGTGFTTKGARELRSTLNKLETTESPFSTPPAGWLGKNAHWVKPKLVAEVAFTEWTNDGKIRHPSFQGLRHDKDPKRIVKEEEKVIKTKEAKATKGTKGGNGGSGAEAVVRGVRVSHPDRIMYENPRLTKLDIVRYYDRIAAAMMPHVEGRPLTLVRCGEGVAAGCFYMKHSKVWAPAALKRVKIKEKTKVGDYLVIESPEGLVSLAQFDILEIHTWNSRYPKVEYPDRVILDLDPGPRVAWNTVLDTAKAIRRLLQKLDLESFVKTTGGKGLHLVVPLVPQQDWSACLDFSRAVAEAMVGHDPDLYTTKFAKSGREAMILIDYMRNNRTNTSVAAFSTRAREGAPVSVPLAWTELTPKLDPAAFTVTTVPARVERQRNDPWADYGKTKQRLSKKAIAALDGLT
jgi:bifunctional non-homologous end joining protein LigD